MSRCPPLVIGVGNRDRGDDGVGPFVARELRRRRPDVDVVEATGEATALLDAWRGREVVLLIDALCTGGTAGTVRLFSTRTLLERGERACSTHGFGVCAAVQLARALDELPALVALGVEGARFDAGVELSPAVRAAAEHLVAWLARGPLLGLSSVRATGRSARGSPRRAPPPSAS